MTLPVVSARKEVIQILRDERSSIDSTTLALANAYVALGTPTKEQVEAFKTDLIANLNTLNGYSLANGKIVKSKAAQELLDFVQAAALENRVTENSNDIDNWVGTIDAGELTADRIDAGSGPFSVNLIPALDASNVPTGVFAVSQIPALDAYQPSGSYLTSSDLNGYQQSSSSFSASYIDGTLDASNIPALDASNVPTGVFAVSQIPALDAYQPSGSYLTSSDLNGYQQSSSSFSASYIDGTLDASNIPALDASKINVAATTLASLFNIRDQIDRVYIPDLHTDMITDGTLHVERLPSLDASQITTGTFAASMVGSLASCLQANPNDYAAFVDCMGF